MCKQQYICSTLSYNEQYWSLIILKYDNISIAFLNFVKYNVECVLCLDTYFSILSLHYLNDDHFIFADVLVIVLQRFVDQYHKTET